MADARDYHEFRGRSILAAIDYIKHLTTLATGAILVLSAFLEKLIAQPEWKFLVVVSFGGFLSSVVFAVPAHVGQVNSLGTPYGLGGRALRANQIAITLQYVSFLIGMVALTIFALKNVY